MDTKKREELADTLGITLDQLRQISALLSSGRSGIAGSGANSAEVITKQLSITEGELKLLRAAVNGSGVENGHTRCLLLKLVRRETQPRMDQRTPQTIKVPRTRKIPTASSLISTPSWVTANRPRLVKYWTPDTTVFVTKWGDKVHLYSDCDGMLAFGLPADVRQVPLRDRICAARTGCLKCCGQFLGSSSMGELKSLIERLHGRLDDGPNRRVRSIIAQKADLRFGTGAPQRSSAASGTPRSSTPARTAKAPSDARTGQSKAAQKGGGRVPTTVKTKSGKASSDGKGEAKRERARREAARLGISEKELKARRRAENDANCAKKAR